MPRPTILCICGSSKFKEAHMLIETQESLLGKIVLTIGVYGHADNLMLTTEQETVLDSLHIDKISMADEVYIVDVDGYMGKSTLRELGYAQALQKPIRFWSKERAVG